MKCHDCASRQPHRSKVRTTVSAQALGDLGRESTGGRRAPARGRDPDQRFSLVGHRLLVLVPAGGSPAGNGSSRRRARRPRACRAPRLRAVHLHPVPVEVVGENADADLGVAVGVARLRPLRVRRHHDAAFEIHAVTHWGELASRHRVRLLRSPCAGNEVKELLAGDGGGARDLGHARDANPAVPATWPPASECAPRGTVCRAK